MNRTYRRNPRWTRHLLTVGLGVSGALASGTLLAQQPADTPLQTDAQAEADAQVDADLDAALDAPDQQADDATQDAQNGLESAQQDTRDALQQGRDSAQRGLDQAGQDAQDTLDRQQQQDPLGIQRDQDPDAQFRTDPNQPNGSARVGGAQDQGADQQGADQQGADARLGVMLADSPDGIVIQQVKPGTAAAQAGLQPGDRIVAINGQPFNTAQQLVLMVQNKNPGDTLEMRVLRNGQEQQIQATLAAWQGQDQQRYSAARVDVGQEERFRQLEQRLNQLETEIQMLRRERGIAPQPGGVIEQGGAFDLNADPGLEFDSSIPADPAPGLPGVGAPLNGTDSDPLEERFEAGAPSDADDPSPETGKANIPD